MCVRITQRWETPTQCYNICFFGKKVITFFKDEESNFIKYLNLIYKGQSNRIFISLLTQNTL